MGYDPAIELNKETKAVKLVLEVLKGSPLEGDDDAIDMSIESETNFKEVIAKLVHARNMDKATIEGIVNYKKNLDARKKRLENRIDWIDTAITVALREAQLPKIETAVGTVFQKKVPDKLMIVNESEIPLGYWTQPPQPPMPEPVLNEDELFERLKLRKKLLAEINDNKKLSDEEKFAAREVVNREHPMIPGVDITEDSYTIQIRVK